MLKKKSFRRELLGSIVRSGILAFVIALVVSYLVFVPILRKEAVETTGNVNHSVIQHLENTMSLVESYTENIAAAIEQNSVIKRYLNAPTNKNKTQASVVLNNLCSYMGNIRGIALASEDVPIIDSMANFTEEDYALFESEYFEHMQTPAFSRSYSPVYQVSVASRDYDTVAYARNFYLNNRWCTILMLFNLNNTLNDISGLADETLDSYYLTDSTGQIFYTYGSDHDIKEAVAAVENKEISSQESVWGDIIFSEISTGSGYGIVSMMKSYSIWALLIPYSAGLFLAMLGFLLLTLFITYRNIGQMIAPVLDLSRHMLRAADGDLECKVATTREDEIGQLEASFNKMIDDLKYSMQVIGEKEAREQKIRFSLLISQIDPHFIYNTINSINYLARKERYQDIIQVNSALIAILRDRLRVNDIQIMDTIANEMRVVNQYILIEKFMYGGNLETIWDVEDELLEEQIPKNMIQPLVENSLFHGLIDEEDGELHGRIIIRMRRDSQGNIILCVSDNGAGMDEERLNEIREAKFNPEDRGSKIGLANIRGRLYYLYDNKECLQVESSPETGTSITITFYNK